MSLEAVTAVAFKGLWAGGVAYIVWVHTKIIGTFNKKETEALFDLKIAPLEQKGDATSQKFDSLMEVIKNDRTQREENTQLLQGIKTDVALTNNDLGHLKNDVESIKNRLDKQQ